LFITFEGVDGAGKTTQINMLAEYFRNVRGTDVKVTREPGGTPVGEKIREILLDPEREGMADATEVLLFAASRAQLVAEVIEPALAAGKTVICDRFLDSSIAYQGAARNIGADEVVRVNGLSVGGLKPDRTFFLDVPPDTAFMRRYGVTEPDRLESETARFHMRAYGEFKRLAKMHPERIVTVDGSQTPEAIHEQIVSNLQREADKP